MSSEHKSVKRLLSFMKILLLLAHLTNLKVTKKQWLNKKLLLSTAKRCHVVQLQKRNSIIQIADIYDD